MSSKSKSNANGQVKTGKKGPSKTVHYYLIGYNVLQSLGWTFTLYKLISYYLNPDAKSLYNDVALALHIFQNAAVLEVIHAATGIVRSNAVLTAFQVASRVAVLGGVLTLTNSAREGLGLPLALIAWCITEIIRYLNYSFTLISSVPYILKYLRYTLFIVLYPIGVSGELLCIWAAQKEVGQGQLYSLELPNSHNFIFNYQHVLWFLMLLYIPLFPQLYLHMFSQRKKALQENKSKSN